MEQTEFERAVLQMAHNGGVSRLTPSAVAYQVRVSVKDAERMLDKMVTNAHLELDSDDDGNLFYFVPGLGAPGIFTSGTAAANPIDPPKPPEPRPGAPYAPYGQDPTGAGQNPTGGGQYGQPYGQPPASSPQPSPYPVAGAPQQQQQYGQPYGQPPAAAPPYGQPAGAPYGQPPAAAPYSGAPQQYGQPYGQPAPPPYGGQAYPSPPQYGQPMNGYGQPYNYGQNALVPQGTAGPKSSAASALLSAMIPGAGQLYNGQVGKGLAFFFISLLMVSTPPMLFVPWMWGIIDAYNTTRRQNAQQHYGLLNP
ncbi:MAG: TM2 domain-containing membrane protein YozV [Bradymonadia bacterium]|jgi:TM2 domain-containing membrane protein YozV